MYHILQDAIEQHFHLSSTYLFSFCPKLIRSTSFIDVHCDSTCVKAHYLSSVGHLTPYRFLTSCQTLTYILLYSTYHFSDYQSIHLTDLSQRMRALIRPD